MKKNAVIKVVSVQDYDKETQVEIVSKGFFTVGNDEFIATYDETELSGLGNTLTTFRIGADYFGLTREGETNTNMYFKRGKNTSILYSTPYGDMNIKVRTNKVDIDVDEDGGNIRIDYDMVVGDKQVINTKLVATIDVK